MGFLFQVLCTVLICGQSLNLGIIYTWPSSTLGLFQSASTPLARAMTEAELALFGSLSSVGAVLATPLAGLAMDRIGRKRTALLASLAASIFWVLVASCTLVEVVLCAMFVSGLSGAVFLVVPVFVSEICQESVRGAMTSVALVMFGLGTLVSYLMGGYLSYYTTVYASLSLSVGATLVLALMRESPVFFMIKQNEQGAAESIGFYRRLKPSSKIVQEEISTIHRAIVADADADEADAGDDATPQQQLKPDLKPKEKFSLWRFLRRSRATRRALALNLVLVTAAIFQGLAVVQVYAESVFREAAPGLAAPAASVLLAVDVVASGLLGAYLTELLGRRPLMVFGSLASGCCCLLLGLELLLQWGPSWLSAVLVYAYCTTYTVSAGTVPFILIGELFVPEVKGFVSMLVMEWTWLCNFVILVVFTPLLRVLGLGAVFCVFAAVSLASAAYSRACLPETRGLPVDAIQLLFAPARPHARPPA